MKKSFLVLLTAVLLAGCVRYDVTLTNGSKLRNVYKPKLNKETQVYTIKSAGGRKSVVPASRVSVIEPHEKEKFKVKDSSQFLN